MTERILETNATNIYFPLLPVSPAIHQRPSPAFYAADTACKTTTAAALNFAGSSYAPRASSSAASSIHAANKIATGSPRPSFFALSASSNAPATPFSQAASI